MNKKLLRKKMRQRVTVLNENVDKREVEKIQQEKVRKPGQPPRIIHDAKNDKVYCVTEYSVAGFKRIKPVRKFDVTEELDRVLNQVYHKAAFDIKHMRIENEDIKIVVLCGSTKFKKTYEHLQKELALNNHIVLSVSGFGKNTKDEKVQLDELHKKKIMLADVVYVIDDKVDGVPYIGESTQNEIAFAEELGKAIVYHSSLDNIKEVKMNVQGVKVTLDKEAQKCLEETNTTNTATPAV
jgi:hypothetical protein